MSSAWRSHIGVKGAQRVCSLANRKVVWCACEHGKVQVNNVSQEMENARETSETQGSRGGEWLIFYSSNLPLYHREVVAMSIICDFDTELALWLGPSKQISWGLGARGAGGGDERVASL